MSLLFKSIFRSSLVLIHLLVFASYSHAEEDAILVLDASGSMWGQIEGEAKIVIARRVIDQLLEDLPADRRLGLVAYGHNRKGDCTDIELVAEVGADRAAISQTVNGLNPKGKTPLSASVKFAAEQLGHTETKATVILISDGEETCNLDPCEVGSALEQTGVDFTAHVIGFDVTVEQHRAQLQCLADNTGGKYLNASNAEELSSALQETVVEVEEVAAKTGLLLRATELKGGPVIESGLSWKIQQASGGDIAFEQGEQGSIEQELAPGTYDIFVERPSDGLKGEVKGVELRPGALKTITVPLELAFEATVRSEPSSEGPVSSDVIVYWTGPDRKGDYVTITVSDARENAYTDYEYTNKGNPLKIKMPIEAGDYEVRYVLGRPAKVLARSPIVATDIQARVAGPESVAAGADFQVSWTGPGYDGDWVTIVKPNAGERAYMDYEYTRKGNPLTLHAPVEAGDYELRYVLSGNKTVARSPIKVIAVEASVSGPVSAIAGTHHPISWTGPAGDRDFITVTAVSDAENKYTDYEYTRKGNPVTIRMPLEAGPYELRYVQDSKKVLARQEVQISEAVATLEAPEEAVVGSMVSVAWTGPGEDRDFITVTEPDENEKRYTDYEYAKKGSPVEIKMPIFPGEYEYRYVLDSNKVIARRSVTLVDAEATVSSPDRVVAGSKFQVEWTGPGNHHDFVTITEVGADDRKYTHYQYARKGSPSMITAPTNLGTYEVRYVLDGKRVLARKSIEVTAE